MLCRVRVPRILFVLKGSQHGTHERYCLIDQGMGSRRARVRWSLRSDTHWPRVARPPPRSRDSASSTAASPRSAKKARHRPASSAASSAAAELVPLQRRHRAHGHDQRPAADVAARRTPPRCALTCARPPVARRCPPGSSILFLKAIANTFAPPPSAAPRAARPHPACTRRPSAKCRSARPRTRRARATRGDRRSTRELVPCRAHGFARELLGL